MNRRQLIQRGGIALVALTVPALQGCTITKAELESWAQDVDTAADTVLQALGASALASELAIYLQQFDAAVEAFPTTGGTFAKVIAIAQDVITVLSDVGIPAAILTIADLCISAVATFIENLGGAPAVSTTSGVSPSSFIASSQTVHLLRTVTLTKFTSRRQAAEKWNAAIAGTVYETHKVKVPLF